jgi:hypothetical protein
MLIMLGSPHVEYHYCQHYQTMQLTFIITVEATKHMLLNMDVRVHPFPFLKYILPRSVVYIVVKIILEELVFFTFQ